MGHPETLWSIMAWTCPPAGTARDRPTMHNSPTPYTDINAVLNLLLSRLRTILDDRLVGLYLYGSLAAGDFDPRNSDIDFVAVTAAPPGGEELAQLETMHKELAANGGEWGKKLEGAYIPVDAVRRYDPDHNRFPFLSADTPFGVHPLDVDWVINLYTLRENGVVIYGPAPLTLVDPISQEQLSGAVRALLCDSWRGHLDGPEWMRSRRYQAFVRLTMCRALYVLEHGGYVSKRAAAAWAVANLDLEWVPLVRQALAWQHDNTEDGTALDATVRFMRFAIGLC